MDTLFVVGALAIFIFMVVFFIIAILIKDNSIVDIGWGLGFIVLDLATLIKAGQYTEQSLLLLALVIVWGLRLATFIYFRHSKAGEDYRYAQWRKEWGKYVVVRSFFQVFMLQGVFMFIIGLPIIAVNNGSSGSFGIFSGIGLALWLVGFYFEAVGDHQKSQFRKNPANHGRIITTGLWRYTRHPNYFGEAMMWWGIFVLSIPFGYWYLSILSPLVLTFLITKVSGVAMLEKKYEGNKEFGEYALRTSAFIPMPPKG